MQVNLHNTQGNQFSHYSLNSVTINQIEYNTNILVTPDCIQPLAISQISQLTLDNYQFILDFQPDLILFGTGGQIQYPEAPLLKALQKQQIGFEVMPIPALCRTFNYLVGEGRKVVALLIF
ncbi:MAG: hypothetical protein RLZZ293_1482 [Pseudomonadota bacterium]|jgi:uncharacterized protein